MLGALKDSYLSVWFLTYVHQGDMAADCEAIQNKYRQTLSLDRILDVSLWVNELKIALKHMSGISSLDTIPDGVSTADIPWLSKFRVQMVSQTQIGVPN